MDCLNIAMMRLKSLARLIWLDSLTTQDLKGRNGILTGLDTNYPCTTTRKMHSGFKSSQRLMTLSLKGTFSSNASAKRKDKCTNGQYQYF
ncbi:hypothetical protein Leryth_026799 [Lithospermum erythrorhizon]|nr:hypothetical protein Leryth_026799 [Lithospermum erythrorhizon]